MIDIAMMVAGVGMQFFNNYANNKKNEELQAKQREFQRAAAEQDFDRMRKLQAESAKISLELEEELHKERINDINNQYDSILENFAHSFTISNWPLNVLPFIMKGESFGSLIHGSTKSINMHCIFTPSNCEWFNSNFYDDIDLRLEAEMNNNWNAQSTHPIVYYGGAWNRQYGETATIDLNDIDLLKINLRGIPTMVVTPYFDPWLHFRVEIWGMGKDTMKHFRIDIPHGDVEFANRIFSYDYNKNENNIEDEDFQNYTVNEFVPYLRNLIGFVADKYFYELYGKTPILPAIIHERRGMSKLIVQTYKQSYLELTKISEEDKVSVSDGVKQLQLLNAISILDQKSDKTIIETFFLEFCRKYSINGDIQDCINECLQNHFLIPFLKEFIQICPQYKNIESQKWLNKIEQVKLDTQDEYLCFKIEESSIDKLLEIIEHEKNNYYKPSLFCFCIWNSSVIVGEFFNKHNRPLLFNGMHRRTIILHTQYDFTPKDKIDFYEYNILTKSIIIMSSKNKQIVSDLRKRFGSILIKHGQRIAGENETVREQPSVKNNPWGPKTASSYAIEDVINYFTYQINEGKIETKYVEHDMSISLVLDWLDSLSITNENKLYLIKGFVKEHDSFIYCSVLAVNDKLLLTDGPTKCFVCPKESDEMKEIFGDTNVYIIPFTD